MKTHNSEEILSLDDLYDLQNTFSGSGISFNYQLTEEEIYWAYSLKDKYLIANYIHSKIEGNSIITFDCPFTLKEMLQYDGFYNKAPMLNDESALQKLFFWLS